MGFVVYMSALNGDETTVAIRKPRPRPAKAQPASRTLDADTREAMARDALYVGSPHHTDIPKFKINAAPRQGAMTIEAAEAQNLKNPDCLICPRKWARRGDAATNLLRAALKAGTYVFDGGAGMPSPVWARDPDDPSLVYEAKLCEPPKGYKAYPLTSFQVEYNLPFEMP